MKVNAKRIESELKRYGDRERATHSYRFLKAIPGGYGEGDHFFGIRVPELRKIAKQHFQELPLSEIETVLRHKVHECRLTALLMLVYRYQKTKEESEREAIYRLYIKNIDHINNWDLIDSSAPRIVGGYLQNRDRKLLFQFARSGDLWKQRIAMMAPFYFIRNGDFDDALKLADILLDHEHDLIHKAVGWMLREIGNRDLKTETNFLKGRYKKMPRTMLRYAIEKFDEPLRKRYLNGTI